MLIVPIILASWILVGLPFPAFIAMTALILGLAAILRCRLTHKTVALLGLMGLMGAQSVIIVLIANFQSWRPPANFNGTTLWLSQLLFGLDFRLAEIGILAGICVGAYIEFVHSRLNLSQAFPSLTFFGETDDLGKIAKKLATKANIDCPEICLIDSGAPCAFATRTRRKYTIALSVGLLESFEPAEVEACLAHEMAHIKNRDFSLRTLVTATRIALFAKVLSYFIEPAIYRTRELLADRTAALLIGSPDPLISALTKLVEANSLDGTPTANAICFFDARKTAFELLSKHPKLSTRIRMLREMDDFGNA